MEVHARLVQSDGADLDAMLKGIASDKVAALVVMSLGADHRKIATALQDRALSCPVYVTETYGIVGFDTSAGRNLELMEKGRGTEYDCRGGDGGQGYVLIAFHGAGVTAMHDRFPEKACSMMVVADGSESFKKISGDAPCLYFGGITKEAYVLSGAELVQVPHFFVCFSAEAGPVGVITFEGDAGKAIEEVLSKRPGGGTTRSTVAMFPCFTRGINEYGRNDVEPEVVAAKFPDGCVTFGMFAHGELGPSSFVGWSPPCVDPQSCKEHGGTTVLALFTSPDLSPA